MTINVVYLEVFNVVETDFSASYTLEEIKEAINQALELAAKKNTNRFLSDLTKLNRGRSVLDIYSISQMFIQMEIPHSIKQAVILPEITSVHKNVAFYETATRNRGFDVKAFIDRSEAMAWLLHD